MHWLVSFFTLLKFQTAKAISFPLGLLHVYKYVVPRIKYGMWAICMTPIKLETFSHFDSTQFPRNHKSMQATSVFPPCMDIHVPL